VRALLKLVESHRAKTWAGTVDDDRVFFTLLLAKRNGDIMAYVINEPCIGTKDTSCVDVCPVDCIHPTPDEAGFDQHDQLYIDPEECIDCDACVEACPVDAITSDDQVPAEWQRYIAINADYYKKVVG
jgi:NAD-dependent dihydropyrimidine dehydrogenase PreA subunit